MKPLILLFVLLSAAYALQLQSTFLNTFVRPGTQGNQTIWQQRTLTLACNNNDFRDPGLLIGNLSYDIFCQAPRYTFQTRLRQFVPEKRRRYVAQVCEVQNVGSFAPVQGIDEQNFGPGRRRLLGLSTAWAEDEKYRTTPNRKLLFFGALFGGFIGGAVFSAVCPSLGDGFSKAFNCGRGNLDPRIDGLINDLEKEKKVLEDFKVWANASFTLASDQDAVNQNVRDMLDTINQQTAGLQNQTRTLNNSIGALAASTDAKFANVSAGFDAVYLSLAAGVDFSQAISLRQQQFENATFRNFQAIINKTQELTRNISVNNRRLLKNDRDNQRMIAQTQALTAKNIAKRQVRRELVRQIAILKQQAVSDGLQPFLHPQFPGADPGVSTPATRRTLVDRILVNFITQPASQFIVHQYTLTFYCNADVILDQTYSAQVWNDIAELLGPVNCTNRPGQLVDNCRCWIEVAHATCQAADPTDPGGTNFNWQKITTTTDRNAYLLTSEKCHLNVQPSTNNVWNGVLIDDLTIFHRLLGELCSVQLADPVGSGGQASGTRRYQISSTRLGIVNFDKPVNPSLTCLPDLDYVFENPTAEVDMIYAVYFSLMKSLQTLLTENQRAEIQTYGILPNFITHETIPFQSLADNRTYTCYRASFIAISPDTRPSFEVQSRTVVPVVTSTAYDRPPVCDNTGCVFGNPATTETTTSSVTSVSFENLLPSASRPIMGEWRTSGVPAMTSIYDICDQCAPVDTVVSSRDGKITYVWQPVPANYSLASQTSYFESVPLDSGGPWPRATFLDKWQENNPDPFNHFKGQFSLDVTDAPLSGGRCILQPDDPVGWPCELLDQWSIHASTNMRLGTLVLIPKTWSYIVTLNIVDGEILQRVFSGCPEFTYTTYTDGLVELQLRNTLPTQNRVITRIQSLTAGCPAVPDVTHVLEPRQVQQRVIPTCGQQTLIVLSIGAGGSLIQCENGLNITFDPVSPVNVKRFTVDFTNRSFVSDEVVAITNDLQLRTLQLQTDLVPLLVTEFTPELTAPQRADAINNLLASYNATLQTVRNVALTLQRGQSASDAIRPFVDQFNAVDNRLTDLQVQSDVQLDRVNTSVLKFSADLVDFKTKTDNLIASIDASIKAKDDLINQLRNQGKQGGACNWCGERLDNIIGDIFCPIFCAIINLFMGLLPILLIGCLIWICFKAALSRVTSASLPSLPAPAPQQQVVYAPPPRVVSAPAPAPATAGSYKGSRGREIESVSLLRGRDSDD